MMKKIKKTIIAVSVILLFILPSFSSAQIFPGVGGGAKMRPDIIFITTPEVPGPYEDVTVKAIGSFDARKSRFYWYENSVLKASGLGKDTFLFKTGPAGETTKIKLVMDVGHARSTNTLTVTPGEIDVLWTADTYTPPFYQGKALPTSQAKVTFVAIPHTKGGASSIFYSWFQNNRKNYAISGYRQRVVTVEHPYDGESNIHVVASINDSREVQSQQLTIETFDPEIIFYPQNTVMGVVYQHALKDGTRIEGQVLKLVSAPYYFSFDDNSKNNGLYTWTVNNQEIRPKKKGVLTLRVPEQQSGEANISLRVHNTEELLQRAESHTSLFF